MTEHRADDPRADSARTTETGTTRSLPRTRPTGAAVRRRTASIAAAVISAVTTVVVVILAVHIAFVVFEANTGNDIVAWFADRATDLAWQFTDVFQPDDPKAEVAVNYGLAALVYLVIGRILVALVRRLC